MKLALACSGIGLWAVTVAMVAVEARSCCGTTQLAQTDPIDEDKRGGAQAKPSIDRYTSGRAESSKVSDAASRRGRAETDDPIDEGSRGGAQAKVKAAQEALKEKGYDPGPIDGRMGQKTRAAIFEFQKATGAEKTGRLDKETGIKLGVSK